MPFHDLTEEEINYINSKAAFVKNARKEIEKAERHLDLLNEAFPPDGTVKTVYQIGGVSGGISIPFAMIKDQAIDRLLEAQGKLAQALAEIEVNLKGKTS